MRFPRGDPAPPTVKSRGGPVLPTRVSPKLRETPHRGRSSPQSLSWRAVAGGSGGEAADDDEAYPGRLGDHGGGSCATCEVSSAPVADVPGRQPMTRARIACPLIAERRGTGGP